MKKKDFVDELEELIKERQYDLAIEKLRSMISNENNPTLKVQLAELLLSTDQKDEGRSILQEIKSLKETKDTIGAISKAIILELSPLVRSDDYNRGIETLEQKKDLFEKLDPVDRKQKRSLAGYNNLMAMFYAKKGDYSTSSKYAQYAIQYFNELEDFTQLTSLTFNLGSFFGHDHPLQAIEFLKQCEVSSKQGDNELGIGYANMELGAIYQRLGYMEEALSCFGIQFGIFQKSDDDEYRSWSFSDLGNGKRGVGKLGESLDLLNQGLMLYETGNDARTLANHLTYLAITTRLIGDFEKSIEYDTRALELYESLSLDSYVMKVKGSLAETQYLLGNLQESKDLINSIEETKLDQYNLLRLIHTKVKYKIRINESLTDLSQQLNSLKIEEHQKLNLDLKGLIDLLIKFRQSGQIKESIVNLIARPNYSDFEIYRISMLWRMIVYLNSRYGNTLEILDQFIELLNKTGISNLSKIGTNLKTVILGVLDKTTTQLTSNINDPEFLKLANKALEFHSMETAQQLIFHLILTF